MSEARKAAFHDALKVAYKMRYEDAFVIGVTHTTDDIHRAVFDAGYDHAAAELRWIPVKTKYPDRPGIYDVTLWDGTISKSAYYVGTFDKSVIAWMPMPTNPYTETADHIAEEECPRCVLQESGKPGGKVEHTAVGSCCLAVAEVGDREGV